MKQTGQLALISCWFLAAVVKASELTFELPDSSRQCFHEDIDQDTKSTIEFQVVTGGQYDVDMTVEAPNRQIMYKAIKKQYDSFNFKALVTGVYTVCFSNEFSTFAHKIVYMDWQVGEYDNRLFEEFEDKATAMTQMEDSSQRLHESLNDVLQSQTYFRLREAQGRKRAEHLNSRVLWWSVGETVVILIIGIGQVMVLRSFFTERKAGGTS